MNTVIIPAAGRGTRIGGPTAKQYIEIAGVSILARTLRQVQDCPDVDAIVVATGEGDVQTVVDIAELGGISKLVRVVVGGAERQDSVCRALESIQAEGTGVVAVHDAVRPFATPSLFSAVIRKARETGAAIAAQFVADTVKQVDGDRIVGTIDRTRVVLAQTPQAFRYGILKSAMDAAKREGWLGTDEAAVVERAGYPVSVVGGSPFNIKVTKPEDLTFAEAIARRFDDPPPGPLERG
jgi:2-C-methyl-D-erythritol 4-phosphate cytidylyltransferase